MNDQFEGKNLVELLDMLEPVPEPPPIPLIPQTPGWIVLGLVMLVFMAWGVRRFIAHRRANAYRRAALEELARAGDDAATIAGLLRRTALAGFPRGQVAPLTGEDWLNFLDQSYGKKGFTTDQGRILISAPFRKSVRDPALTALVGDWVRHHRRGAV